MRVSPLCLGTFMFGASWGTPDRDASVAVVHAALDAGINFVDTADVYSAGEAERIVGRALAGGRRDGVILATKVHGQVQGSDPNRRGSSRRWITQACEDSLRRLGTDWIDLYQIHRPDPDVDVDETLGALTDLVRAGKIRAFGSSKRTASQIVEAQWTAERRARERFVTEQPRYSLLARGAEGEVLPTCQRHGLGVMTWSPLAGGWLTDRRHEDDATFAAPAAAAQLRAVEQLARLAEEAGISLVHLALAFVLQHPAVTTPIIGPRSVQELESHLGAVDVALGTEILDRIDAIVAPGTTLAALAADFVPPALTDPALRRRPPAVAQAPGSMSGT